MRRILVLVAVIVTALLLQTTVFPELTLLGVKPELLYLVTVIFAVLQGPAEGAVVGFVGGLAQDFMLNMPKGITALTLTMLGYTVGLARQFITSPSPLLPAILVGLGTAGGVAFHQAVAFLLGEEEGPFGYVAKVVLLTAVYGAVLTPIFFPVLRRASAATHVGRVVRF
ncbi:MAG TPA: rod shape-determining protein MreD [Actinomycetota bacterium]|nr:rod shape-determining protein MreD [Actinomycetota bacterium]